MRESETTEAGLRASTEGSRPRAASFVAVPAYKRVLLGDGAAGDLEGWGGVRVRVRVCGGGGGGVFSVPKGKAGGA